MPSQKSLQDQFAQNLKGHCLDDTGLYRPLEFHPHCHRVGDIAFFDSNGKYEWIQNAFYSQVFLIPVLSCQSDIQSLERLGWRRFMGDEDTIVIETSFNHATKLAIGGSATVTKKELAATATTNLKESASYLLYV